MKDYYRENQSDDFYTNRIDLPDSGIAGLMIGVPGPGKTFNRVESAHTVSAIMGLTARSDKEKER